MECRNECFEGRAKGEVFAVVPAGLTIEPPPFGKMSGHESRQSNGICVGGRFSQ